MFDKGLHWWMAAIGAAIYVYSAQKDMPFLARLLKVSGACLLGVSVAPEIEQKFGTGENLTLIAVITLGWVVIDTSVTLVKEHRALIELIKKLNGGGK